MADRKVYVEAKVKFIITIDEGDGVEDAMDEIAENLPLLDLVSVSGCINEATIEGWEITDSK